MALPTEKRKPMLDLAHMPILIYGPPKIGKSTWCSQADNALFLATEAGLDHLEVYEQTIADWAGLVNVYEELKNGNHQYKTIILDTVDNAYAYCLDHFCKKNKIEHPSDLAYGKGWAMINGPFRTMLNRFALLPYGFILVSHSREKEIQTRTGPKIKVGPALSGSVLDTVTSFVEMILYFTVEEKTDAEGNLVTTQVVRTLRTPDYEAGSRIALPDPMPYDFKFFLNELLKHRPREAPKK